jgi:hypothetical protein
VAETAEWLGVTQRAVLEQRGRPEHRALMAQLAERHLEDLAAAYRRALVSALADLDSPEWMARDKAREWLSKTIEAGDKSRGLGHGAQMVAEAAAASGQYTLTEVLTVLRQVQVAE